MTIVARGSRKALGMPVARIRLPVDRTFSAEAYRRISDGLTPQQMEDKRFIYLDDDWLACHRNRTGYCSCRARLEQQGERFPTPPHDLLYLCFTIGWQGMSYLATRCSGSDCAGASRIGSDFGGLRPTGRCPEHITISSARSAGQFSLLCGQIRSESGPNWRATLLTMCLAR
jgi:hypothetical protein